MSIVARRILSILLKRNKNPRLYSTVSANGTKERIVSSSILGEQLASSTPPPEFAAAAGRVGGKPLSFLKYTVLAAFTGGVATAGYATYVVAHLLETLSKRFDELRKVGKSLKAKPLKLVTTKDTLVSNKRKKKIELEPKQFIAGLHCNTSLHEGVKFVDGLVIEKPEHRIFFYNVYNQPAFQRVFDIHIVQIGTLVFYKFKALHHKSPESEKFIELLDNLIKDRPDKEEYTLKKVKMEQYMRSEGLDGYFGYMLWYSFVLVMIEYYPSVYV
ncbi:haloacid dehalogenase-like hydrolase (HAD) superfamily protein [Artemisia annua]|uniref:Haloacid dehalogenase-like hydrolase (HAD) superfamily protein n=1 Tax=Artemisia annua TaxID=35608 RepID=A0A2U1Q480_ARTAN|nr:haloacid dehalogenase-like hydrolase (HAD) superfamily protein [Artemisia annua]